MPLQRRDLRRIALVLAAIGAIVLIPAGIFAGVRWLDYNGGWSGSSRMQARWLTSGDLRATTSDGTLVKLRVAFEAGSQGTVSALQQRLRDVGLMLELCISERRHDEVIGAQGIERLSRDMLARVNAYLETEQVEPVKAVMIQDIWYTRP